ncbi:glycosyltransferase [Paraburkholderia fungorum]|uniref:glycosyltransferase n=1 Tax=Paraburkholderia fungorum TaxID=134537 RepID=UPI003877A8BB
MTTIGTFQMTITVTAIIPLVGDYRQVQPLLVNLVKDLASNWPRRHARLDVIFVGDGEHWTQVVDIAGLRRDHDVRHLSVRRSSMPACLFNSGALLAKGEFLAFLWPGVNVVEWMAAIERLAQASDSDDFLLAGKPSFTSSRAEVPHSWLCDPSDGNVRDYPPGWVEMADFVPMANCLVRRAAFLEAGGFSTSILLQRSFWWEFSLRYSRMGRIRTVDDQPAPEVLWTWHDYPLAQDLGISGDLSARRVMRASLVDAISPNIAADLDDAFQFAKSLPSRARSWLFKQIRQFSTAFDAYIRENGGTIENSSYEPLRVTVLGGPGEPAHNQLCFFNYFALLENECRLTWRTVLDTAAHTVDLINSDLVIFSRIKSEQGCRLMDFCVATGIPTVYMLDDNWFTVAKDWPVYATLFSKDSPIYKAFTYCLSRSTVALTYNQFLVEDMRPYARDLVLLPTNINLTEFKPVTKSAGKKKIVGYVGSARPDDVAFRALASVAMRRNDFDVLYMGPSLPDCLRTMPAERLLSEPYVYGYRRYVQILSKHSPDILLAPLGDSRFEASKCPNKFLEISAVHASGIYSAVEPYLSVVEDGVTGLFAESSQASWEKAIESLLDDEELRSRIHENAYKKVVKEYATENVVHHFDALLRKAVSIRGTKPSDERHRVAFISHSAHYAGAERALVNFICNLSPSIEPIAVFPPGGGPIQDLVSSHELPVIQLDYDFSVPRFGDGSHVRLEDAKVYDYIARFGRLFRELEIDGVVVNTNVLQSAVFAAAISEIPAVLHSHGVISSRLDPHLCAKRWSYDDAQQLELATAVVCPSELVADAYVDLYMASPDKIAVVPNGTDCHAWHPLPLIDSEPHRFSMLCTLEPNKNVPMFIEAAQILKTTETSPIEFHIYGAGGGDYVNELKELVREKSLGDVVFFHPKTSNVAAIYDRSRAIVVTSQLESFSFVAIEAMSRARPVISTRCGGPEGIITDGETGLLVNKNDALALAKCMQMLHHDVHLAQRIGLNARLAVEKKFDIKVVGAAYSNLLSSVFSNASASDLHEKRNIAVNYIGARQAISWPDVTLSASNYFGIISTEEDKRQSLRRQLSLGELAIEQARASEINRVFAIQNANLASVLLNGRIGRIRQRLALQGDLWNLVDENFSSIKSFCGAQHAKGRTKLVLSSDLRAAAYVEYTIDASRMEFSSISTPIQLAVSGMKGLFGMEMVDSSNRIVFHTSYQIADIDASRPVEIPVSTAHGRLKGIYRVRFFVRDTEAPVWMFEFTRRRYAGLKKPAKSPFIALK